MIKMGKEKEISKKILETLEGVVLFLAIFDLYEGAIAIMLLSIFFLVLDLKLRIIKEEEEVIETFKKYFSFPVILIVFYILFGIYSTSNIKFVILLAGYASLRVVHVYFKRGEKDGINKV